jgi:macrolide-specific efflux system membrane fusion protein
MTVETEISEADIGRIEKGMQVYFTTLGGGNRRWYSELRQILPTPVVENNVVLYTGLFDVDNSDGALLSDMTAQVYFVTSSANNVLTVPVGALTFIDQQPGQPRTAVAARAIGAADAGGNGGIPQFTGSGPEGMTDEMRERLRERLANGQGIPAQGGFGIAANARPGGAQDAAPRRLATVQVVRADGSQEKREIIVGVTSRIAAEVISGLEVGEQVVAGILQAGMQAPAPQQGDDRREVFRAMGGFR